MTRFSLVAALAGALLASPAAAQGKGHGQDKKDRERPELVRRTGKAQEKARKKEYERREKELKREYEQRRESLRQERERWERRDDDDRWDDRDERWDDDDRWEERGRYEERDGGPPFCRNGKGHPVHGRKWCEQKGYGSYGRYDTRNGDYGRYDSRSGDYGRYGSYEEAHRGFHRELDQWYRMRASERPLDVQYQVRLRSERNQRHDDWHRRMGRQHD